MNRQYTEVIHNDLAAENDSPAVRELVEAARAELTNGADPKVVIKMLQSRGLAYPTALAVNNWGRRVSAAPIVKALQTNL